MDKEYLELKNWLDETADTPLTLEHDIAKSVANHIRIC